MMNPSQLPIGTSVPEQPIYTLAQSKKRAVIPILLSLIILSIIFYVGILLNLSLLELRGMEETTVKIGSLVLLLFIVLLGTVVAVRNAHREYLFFHNRVTFGTKSVAYASITNTLAKKDFSDRLFHTYSINLNGKFILRHIPDAVEVGDYLTKLQEYAGVSHQ